MENEKVPPIVTALVGALIMSFVNALIVKVCWNLLMPELFKLPEVSFWQAYGLTFLVAMLFRGNGLSIGSKE